MFCPVCLRDIREPRDWKRRWKDPPGLICCCTPSYCDNVNQCSTVVLTDLFTSWSGWTESACGVGFNKLFSASSGFASETFGFSATPRYTGGAGAAVKAITIPALNGLCISVAATIYGTIIGKVVGTTGVVIGGVGRLFGRIGLGSPAPTPWASGTGSLSTGCSGAGTTHTFGPANTDFSDGDCLCLVLQDTSSGGGTYSLKSYVNGSLMDTFSGLSFSLTAGSTINVGIFDTNGGRWGPFRAATS